MNLENLTTRQIENIISGNNMIIEQLQKQLPKAASRIDTNIIYQKIKSREGVNDKLRKFLSKKFKDEQKESPGE
jgi:hypothetical protein